MDIILYLLNYINCQRKIIGQLLNFICRYIPLKQWAFDDSHSLKYQKFKVDKLPKIISCQQDWTWKDLIPYYQKRYGKTIKPVFRRVACDIPSDCTRPMCKAPVDYLTWNNGKTKTQILCKVCQTKFSTGNNNRFSQTYKLKCPYCSHSLVPKKNRKHFIVHKCVNPKCSYYLCNLRKVDKEDSEEDYGKNKYKLHYIYREFTIDFFKMDLSSLPKNASSLKFKQHDSYIMSLCLTYRVNLGLSLRKTAQALKDIHGIKISHQQVANYCTTAAICVKPFTDSYDYKAGNVLTADETYIKIRGVKGYIWFIMDAAKRSILGYQISDNRGVGPCILSMRMAFKHFKDKLPEHFKFIADGYSAYPLAAQQFLLQFGEKFKFDITQVIGLKNDDEVSAKHRPYKQMIERLNRTYKESYRPTNGFDNIEGANYDLYYIWKELIYIEIQKPNRFKDLLHKIHSKVEDILFSILQHTPDKFIPKSLMRWFEKYTNKRLAQLKSDVIRKRWQTIELEKAVDNIHNWQQP